MKKIILVIVVLMCSITFVHGQTNTFPSSGNVGIGTTSPSAKLEVHGSSSQYLLNAYSSTISRFSVNGRGIGLFDINNGASESGEVAITTPSGDPGFIIYTGASHDQHRFDIANRGTFFSFGYPEWDYWGYTLTITEDGDVGIGTSAPQSKLAVNGTVTAKQVKVTQTGWPDYVFGSSYVLPSLDTIKSFIHNYHHLPGIPSAVEIENKGLDLGDMQKRQMQKIEDMMLYIVQQHEQIKSLQEMVSRQEKEIAGLEKRLDP